MVENAALGAACWLARRSPAVRQSVGVGMCLDDYACWLCARLRNVTRRAGRAIRRDDPTLSRRQKMRSLAATEMQSVHGSSFWSGFLCGGLGIVTIGTAGSPDPVT